MMRSVQSFKTPISFCSFRLRGNQRLALATILQFVEGISDRAAADAVRSRIDWKYLFIVTSLKEIGFGHGQTSDGDSGLGQSTIINTRHPFFATQPFLQHNPISCVARACYQL
jgi:transposase-like protein DUF772